MVVSRGRHRDRADSILHFQEGLGQHSRLRFSLHVPPAHNPLLVQSRPLLRRVHARRCGRLLHAALILSDCFAFLFFKNVVMVVMILAHFKQGGAAALPPEQ